MPRIALGASAGLATGLGMVGAVVSHGEGAFTIGTVLVLALLGSVAIHAVLNPADYGEPDFNARFYRVWAATVPLLALAVLLAGAGSPGVAAPLAYWAGFAATAVFAGAVVGHRSTRARVEP